MPNIWNGTMFGDLDLLLNASCGLSAIAEFLVFIYCILSLSNCMIFVLSPVLHDNPRYSYAMI